MATSIMSFYAIADPKPFGYLTRSNYARWEFKSLWRIQSTLGPGPEYDIGNTMSLCFSPRFLRETGSLRGSPYTATYKEVEEIGPEHERRYRFTWLIKENASDTMWMQVSGDIATAKASARELASKEAFEFLEIRYRKENV
ncbi:hypothetical protein FRC14_005261 [Serendipita sp. 396]|nr:hypothetical protein FRC14_005261 [Serendipita sp. 396]KAG8779160.1 hypothetical protein FRC15_010332 [Serendipita sp. 397]KAG8802472.1 hypothetical protein FRC16_009476 [Serendipita sp. 398]KAG8865436.1 hypothetical protein FRC20_009841 [Serendipita sp. 405]KAG9020102.1 hypothetical protein FS842_007587 [Serendipita sp. 407]